MVDISMDIDITEKDLITSLQEALTYYLAYLSHSQKLLESRLPHQGKNVETVVDISTRLQYQRRVVASETCLQYTGRIARRVRRWQREVQDPDDDVERVEEAPCVEVDVETLHQFLEAVPEDLFLDPFSGKLIGGTGTSCAGPCTKSEILSDRDEERIEREATPRSIVQKQEPYRRIAHEYMDKNSKARRSRPLLGLHANIPIIILPTAETESRRSSNRSSDASIEPIMTPTSSVSEQETDTPIHKSETKTKPLESEASDWRYAEQLEAEEKQRRNEARKAFVEARKLSAKLAEEEHEHLEEQRRYARRVEREERKYAEQVKLDRGAAARAQARLEASEQKRSEDRRVREKGDATLRAAEAKMKAEKRGRNEWNEERKRIPDPDEQPVLAKEKKVRFGRPNADIKSRRQAISIADEKRWRDAYQIQEGRNRAAERETKDKESRSKKVDCVSCMEPGIKREMAVLPCTHAYCQDCIKGAFESALTSRTPFKCCGKAVSATKLAIHLSPSFISRYNALLIELSTPNPLYCSSPTCSKFLPPSSIHGPIAHCTTCRTRTCTSCKTKEHAGVCKEDTNGKKVQDLARKHGWKQCPNCSQILERTEGCLHMTCRCRAEWCYACLRDWRVCNSTCGREENVAQGQAANANARGGNARQNNDLVGGGGVRVPEDILRRLTEENLQRVQRHLAGRQEDQGFVGLLPALARSLIMAMFEE